MLMYSEISPQLVLRIGFLFEKFENSLFFAACECVGGEKVLE